MSESLDMLKEADHLADQLERFALLADVPIIVARQKDIGTAIDEAVAKAAGAAVLIALDGWQNVNAGSNNTRLELSHSVSLWTAPILYDDQATQESELLGALISAVGTITSEDDACEKWITSGGRYIAHPRHRIYEFSASLMIDLPMPSLTQEPEPEEPEPEPDEPEDE